MPSTLMFILIPVQKLYLAKIA